MQGNRRVFKSRGESSNAVGRICPLPPIEIGLTDLEGDAQNLRLCYTACSEIKEIMYVFNLKNIIFQILKNVFCLILYFLFISCLSMLSSIVANFGHHPTIIWGGGTCPLVPTALYSCQCDLSPLHLITWI